MVTGIEIEKTDITSRYVASIYWAFTTMTTVGYGDILPTTDTERLFATFIMFVGATVFGYIVGVVREVASNSNGAAARERLITGTTNHFLIEQKIETGLRTAVKKHLGYFLNQ